MQRKKAPSRRPQQQIRLPLQRIHIREESRRDRRRSQQRNRNIAIVNQVPSTPRLSSTRSALTRLCFNELSQHFGAHTNSANRSSPPRFFLGSPFEDEPTSAHKTKYLHPIMAHENRTQQSTYVLVAKKTASLPKWWLI